MENFKMTDNQLTTDKINPYEYQVTSYLRHPCPETLTLIADELYSQGWEFLGFLGDKKALSRRTRSGHISPPLGYHVQGGSIEKINVGSQLTKLLDVLSFQGMTAEQCNNLSTDELHEIIADAYQKIGWVSHEIGKIVRVLK